MPQASLWKATANTVRSSAGIVVMHGGPAAGTIPEHSHVEVEVSVHFRSSGVNGVPTARHAHLYPPGMPHSGGWKAGHEVVVFLLSPFLIESAAEECLLRARFEIKSFTHLRDRMLEEAGRAILDEFHSSRRFAQFYVESIGNALAGYLLRNFAESSPRMTCPRALSDPDLRRIRRFIEEHIEIGFGVAELAGAIGLRPQEFSRKLHRAVGLSPWQFVNSVRLSVATQMLRTSTLPIADIASRLGFVDQSHFTNAFRRMSGITPGAFRNRR